MIRKFLAGLVSAFMIGVGLVAMPNLSQPAQAAPPASAFDPGYIISDSVFYDFGSMTVQEIQEFLDSVNAMLAETGTEGQAFCLFPLS